MARKDVSADFVRTWAATEAGTKALTEAGAKFPGKRGRLHPTTVAVFHKSNRGKRYVTGNPAPERTVTVQVPALTPSGRATTRKVTVTMAEARDLTGSTGKRGRIREADLILALEAQMLAEAGV